MMIRIDPKHIIRRVAVYISLLPLRRKVMIISVLLMGLNYYTAPLGMGLLTVFSIIEAKSCYRKNKPNLPVRKMIRESIFLIPGIILLFSAVFGAIYNGNHLSALLALIILAPILLTAVLIQFLWTNEDGLHFARYSVMLILPVSLFAFLFPWPGRFFIFARHGSRLMGTFGNPNYFAYILDLFLLFAAALFYHAWNKNTRVRLIIPAAAGFVCLYLTGSRTGLIAFFAGTTILFFIMAEKKIMCALLLSVSLILIISAAFPETAVKIIAAVFPRTGHLTSGFESRFELWNIALRQINKNPFVGTGLFTFNKYVPVNAPDVYVKAVHAHNIFLNFWLETGLPGVLSFVWMICAVTAKALRTIKDSPYKPYLAAVIAMFAVTTAHGITDAPLMSAQTIAFFGIFTAAASTGSRKSRSDDDCVLPYKHQKC